MKTGRDKPDTAIWNQKLNEKADQIVAKAQEELARAMNTAEGLRRQAECEHEWADFWDYYHDGHRGDSEQIWHCTKKCGARTPS